MMPFMGAHSAQRAVANLAIAEIPTFMGKKADSLGQRAKEVMPRRNFGKNRKSRRTGFETVILLAMVV